MKSTDRTILIIIGLVGLIAAFWFLLLAPKREEASQLEDDVAAMQAEVAEAEEAAVTGEAAKKGFSKNYRELVSLGKAVPKDADTSSLLVELQVLANRAKIDFRGIELDETAAGAVAAPAAATAPAPAPAGESATPAAEGTTTARRAVPTEATAALLPIGATVGTAGLPVMPYAMEFQGRVLPDRRLLRKLDRLVDSRRQEHRRQRPPAHDRRLQLHRRRRGLPEPRGEPGGVELSDTGRPGHHRWRHADGPRSGNDHSRFHRHGGRTRARRNRDRAHAMKKIDVKVPSFLNDLYRDLRDRHLLIPALGLIVALVAVPMVLGKEKKPLPPPPRHPTATEAAATSPAVLADTEVSVRDYRERLEALKSKNPFEQKFVIPAQPLTDSSATGTGPTDTSGLPPSSTNAGGAVGTTSLPDPPAGVTTDNTSGDSDDGDTRVVNQLFVRRVDVMVGIQGDTRSRRT